MPENHKLFDVLFYLNTQYETTGKKYSESVYSYRQNYLEHACSLVIDRLIKWITDKYWVKSALIPVV